MGTYAVITLCIDIIQTVCSVIGAFCSVKNAFEH